MDHRPKDPFVDRLAYDRRRHECELMGTVEFRAWAARRGLSWEEACCQSPETIEISPGVVMHIVSVKVGAPSCAV